MSFEKRQKTDRNSLVVPNRAKNKAKKKSKKEVKFCQVRVEPKDTAGVYISKL